MSKITATVATPVQQDTFLHPWILASRPKTLPAAAAPVIVGSALALYDGKFALLPALAALAAGLLLQIGANLANDVFDFHKGADTAERMGPLRVTQAGLLTSGQVMIGMWVTFGLAALCGLYLAAVAGWVVLAIGISCILAALAYTGGPFPFGYYGLGDLAVFIFFGLVAVIGTYYVQARTVTFTVVWAAIPMGLLITAILVVNNLRDIHTDRAAGKKTLAVHLGEKGTQWEYTICLAGSYLVPVAMWLAGIAPVWVLLSWASIPLAVSLVRMIYTLQGRPLNQALAGTGRLALVYGCLFGLGFILSGIGF